MRSTPFTLSRRGVLAGSGALALAPLAVAVGHGYARAAAPAMGPSQPGHYRFTLGGFECTTINDGSVAVDGPHPIFGQNVDPGEVAALAEANFLPADKMRISFTPVIVNTGSEVVLFDSGNGTARRPDAGQLAEALAPAGYSPEQVDVVVVTHFHPDHIGGLMEDGQPLFPNARYVIGETEYDFWSPEDKLTGGTERVARLVQSNVVPLAEKATFVKDGHEVVPGITAIEAFGHTPGHMAFHVESDGRRLVLIADASNHYVASIQRPDWHVSFDMDKENAVEARKRLLDMIAAEKVPFTGYHMPFPAVGFIEKTGTSYRYVPATYQLHL